MMNGIRGMGAMTPILMKMTLTRSSLATVRPVAESKLGQRVNFASHAWVFNSELCTGTVSDLEILNSFLWLVCRFGSYQCGPLLREFNSKELGHPIWSDALPGGRCHRGNSPGSCRRWGS